MKRIKYACIEQTLHFQLKEDINHDEAARMVSEEVMQFKTQLERRLIKYKIVEEKTLNDGSILIKLKRQYNNYDCGDYLN